MSVGEAKTKSFDILQNGWQRSIAEKNENGERYIAIDLNQDKVPDFLIIEPKSPSLSVDFFVLNETGKNEWLKIKEQDRDHFLNSLAKWRKPLQKKPVFHSELNSLDLTSKERLQQMLTDSLTLSVMVLCHASIVPSEKRHRYMSFGGFWDVELSSRRSQENDSVYDLVAIHEGKDFEIGIMNFGDWEPILCREINEGRKKNRTMPEPGLPVKSIRKPIEKSGNRSC